MDITADISSDLGNDWIPAIYNTKVRTQRTRSFELDVPQRENKAEIQFTLLGIELKVGRQRLACPDLATARYLCIFARIGCPDIAVPYDITKISGVADDLESSWQRMLVIFEKATQGSLPRSLSHSRSRLIASVRDELALIGSGSSMPLFDRETKQRKR